MLLTAPKMDAYAVMKILTVVCRLVGGCQHVGETYFLYTQGSV